MVSENTIQFIAILITVTGLLGWLLKQVINFFILSSNEKVAYIEKLVQSNQVNTENFVNTINHQRTLDREMQMKHLDAIKELKTELSITNKVNTEILEYFKDKHE